MTRKARSRNDVGTFSDEAHGFFGVPNSLLARFRGDPELSETAFYIFCMIGERYDRSKPAQPVQYGLSELARLLGKERVTVRAHVKKLLHAEILIEASRNRHEPRRFLLNPWDMCIREGVIDVHWEEFMKHDRLGRLARISESRLARL